MGTPEFACRSLAALADSKHDLLAVVTRPDKPSGRGKKLRPTPLSDEADRLGLMVLKPESLKSRSLLDELEAMQPDLFVIVAFRILPEKLFSLPRLGSINIHASLLPKYRGAAPIQWALINGEKTTGLTSFYLKKAVDTGDLILQREIDIEENDNYDSLSARLANDSGPFLLETLDAVEQGRINPVSQDNRLASPAPKISPFDAMIDFGFPSEKVRNFIRGLSSRPGAFTFFRGKRLKVLGCRLTEDEADNRIGSRPGTILVDGKRLVVQCADSALEITEVAPEGKKAMPSAGFINGYKPSNGELLGETKERFEEKQ